MENRRRRTCSYCGFLTAEEYTDEGWDAIGQECEECIDTELVDRTIDE
jgi:hypothetical protein